MNNFPDDLDIKFNTFCNIPNKIFNNFESSRIYISSNIYNISPSLPQIINNKTLFISDPTLINGNI
jgi:hypothetical protein